MMKVVNVLMICFELTLLKKALEEEELKETDEFNENDDDNADERKRNT